MTTATATAKKAAVIGGGCSSLCVVIDFDRTITSYWCDRAQKIQSESCYGMLETYSHFSEEMRAKMRKLYEHYHPIELDLTIPHEKKEALMIEWWDKSHQMLLQTHITKAVIRHAVASASYRIRPGFTELLQLCKTNKVPLVICSAGLKDVIVAVLEREGLWHEADAANPDNVVHIVSNAVRWHKADGQDREVCVGFGDEIIHVLNKGIHASVVTAAGLRERCNAVVIGDHDGDARMADEIAFATVYKIGLLNLCRQPDSRTGNGYIHNDQVVDLYQRIFDEIIYDDGDLSPLVDIVCQAAAVGAAAPRQQ